MLFTEVRLRARAHTRLVVTTKNAKQVLTDSRDTARTDFDIFLSHSILDAELILGAKLELEDRGFTVYVDWICDPLLDRTKVEVATASHLRRRMNQCKMLAYLHSENSALSKWCPWELGYFDALRGGNVFILPVASGTKHSFEGQEYLGLYPYLEPTSETNNIWIEKSDKMAFLAEARTRRFSRK